MLHCNGIDPFVTLMGNFDWGPISHNDSHMVSWTDIYKSSFFPETIRDWNLLTDSLSLLLSVQ